MIPRRLLYVWLAVLVFKLFLGAILPMAADENYYWVWSQNPHLSYFDHPGMVAWLLWLGKFFSFGSAVRWPLILLGHFTIWIWILILKEQQFTENIIGDWMWLALCSPLIGFGSLIATPDVPFVFFWSTSFYLLLLRLKHVDQAAPWDLALGLSLGLGFCAKYHIVIFVPLAMIYLTLDKKWRFFPLPSILRITGAGLLASLPVLIWNAQHQFASFKFQLQHGLGEESWDPFWTYSYPLGQILLLFPIPAFYAIRAWKEDQVSPLKIFSWGTLGFFLLSSFKGLVEMNWPIAAHPGIFAIAAKESKSRALIIGTSLVWLTTGLLIASHILSPWIPSMPKKLDEFSAYEAVLPAVSEFTPLFGENYQMASYVWFKTKHPFFKLRQMSRPDFFDELSGSQPTEKSFFVAMDKDAGLPDWLRELHPEVHMVRQLDSHLVVNRIDLAEISK